MWLKDRVLGTTEQFIYNEEQYIEEQKQTNHTVAEDFRFEFEKGNEAKIFNLEGCVPPKNYFDISHYEDSSERYHAYFNEIRSLETVGELKVVSTPANKEILCLVELLKYKFDNITKKTKHKV